jgi:P27 family predicted phage terminase small subunit
MPRGGRRYGSGQKPKPTALKKLANNPGGRPLNESEPQPEIPTSVPKPPDYLDGDAKKEWERRAKQLLDLGLLTDIDTTAFETYCMAYGRFAEANRELKKGMIIKSPNDYPILNPYLSVLRQAVAEMGKFLVEFGMTPSSRSRIQVKRNKTPEPAAPAVDSMDKLEDKYLN